MPDAPKLDVLPLDAEEPLANKVAVDRGDVKGDGEQGRIVDMDLPLKLNVGGKLFWTTRRTLRNLPQSKLGRMFGGAFGEPTAGPDGAYFVDREPRRFHHILDFYRNLELNLAVTVLGPTHQLSLARALRYDALYLGIEPLQQALEALFPRCTRCGISRLEVTSRLCAARPSAASASALLLLQAGTPSASKRAENEDKQNNDNEKEEDVADYDQDEGEGEARVRTKQERTMASANATKSKPVRSAPPRLVVDADGRLLRPRPGSGRRPRAKARSQATTTRPTPASGRRGSGRTCSSGVP